MLTAVCLSMCLFAANGTAQPPASETKPAPSVLEFPAKEPPPNPVTVADVIKGLGLDEAKMRYGDEPPCILRELRWPKAKLPGTESEVEIVIQIGGRLFSEKRRWDMKEVRAATVLKVTITPPRPLD